MFLSYAVDRNKQWLHISDVTAGGRTTDLFCPFCGRPIIAKKGRVLIHHFAHEANQSCREWASLAHYVAPEEGYYGADLSTAQQRMLRDILETPGDAPFAAEPLKRSTLAALVAKGFVNCFSVPHPYYSAHNPRMTNIAQITARAKAFAHQLTLVDYAKFAEAEINAPSGCSAHRPSGRLPSPCCRSSTSVGRKPIFICWRSRPRRERYSKSG